MTGSADWQQEIINIISHIPLKHDEKGALALKNKIRSSVGPLWRRPTTDKNLQANRNTIQTNILLRFIKNLKGVLQETRSRSIEIWPQPVAYRFWLTPHSSTIYRKGVAILVSIYNYYLDLSVTSFVDDPEREKRSKRENMIYLKIRYWWLIE